MIPALHPDLSGALFIFLIPERKRREKKIKKRERKAEKVPKEKKKKKLPNKKVGQLNV